MCCVFYYWAKISINTIYLSSSEVPLPWDACNYRKVSRKILLSPNYNNIKRMRILCSNGHTSHACYRPTFARTPTFTRVRTRVLGQSGHRVPLANQNASALVTPKRPMTTSAPTVTRHASTRTPSRNIVYKAVLSLIPFLPHLSAFDHRAILIWGDCS